MSAARTVGAAVAAALVLPGCTGGQTKVRQPFEVVRADPASSEVVVAMSTDACSKTHVESEETDTAVLVLAYYTKRQRAECPDTERRVERVIRLQRPLGSRAVLDGIPPQPTVSPGTEPFTRPLPMD